MATYFLETITSAQALNYNAATDSLSFSSATASGGNTLLVFDPNSPAITILSTLSGKSAVFGPGLAGETDADFADGSRLLIGTNAGEILVGAATGDGLYGGGGADTISGGPGNDVIDGGAGPDVITGGLGFDHFIFEVGQSAPTPGAMDTITDWQFGDLLSFSLGATQPGTYVESTAASFSEALTFANAQIAAGTVEYVAVAVGSDVELFADTRGDHGSAEDVVILAGRGLNDIDITSIVSMLGAPGSPPPPPPPPPVPPPAGINPPTLPPAPSLTAFAANGNVFGNMDGAHLSDLLTTTITNASDTNLALEGGPNLGLSLVGVGFDYVNDALVGGAVTHLTFNDMPGGAPGLQLIIDLPNTPASLFEPWLIANATQTALQTLFAGSDRLVGDPFPDLIRGFDGNDLIFGSGGGDTIFGGLGNDVIHAGPSDGGDGFPGQTYLRGDEGDDYIVGASSFDDANGNMGNDTISTGGGDDYSVGGKDNDLLFGDAGNDIVWGNLGNDTCVGGVGNDQVRGGQGDDWVYGGNGDDFVSGDRGNDTVVGGAGADIFHGSQDAGIDRVLDFNAAEGDRVQLDPGTTYTLIQVGQDAVLDMGNGNEMILVGVEKTTLAPGWVFGA
jgi:Ca2+-binding RTX toxin-like protein